MSAVTTQWQAGDLVARLTKRDLIAFASLLVSICFASWNNLLELIDRWSTDPQYSYGFIAPLFSLYLCYTWRDSLPSSSPEGRFFGVVAILAGLGLQKLANYLNLEPLANLMIVVMLGGAVLASFGNFVFRWALIPIVYLVVVIPLPFEVAVFARKPLRRLGTLTSTYALQVLGYAAFSTGNLIELGNGAKVEVAEACSGLRMLMVFVALSIALALISDRPIWERILLLASSVPIALVSNIIRIVMTAIVFAHVESGTLREQAHDWFGLAMMPVGLGLYAIESWILARLLIVEQARPLTPDAMAPAMPVRTT